MADAPYGLPRPEFREQKKGYHPDEVDQWIDNAFETVEQMNREISELTSKLQAAMSAPSSSGGGSTQDLDETLRRTLVLAQKTADAAIKEAQEEASRISSEAKFEAQKLIGEATEHSRRLAQDAQQHVRADVLKLEAARTELQNDVEKLRAHLDEERERVKIALSKALDLLDRTADERRPTPAISDVQIPSENPVESGFAFPSDESLEEPVVEEAPPWANPGGSSAIPDNVFGESKKDSNDEDNDDDDYITQLRRAVADPTPLGPRDDDAPKAGKASYEDLTGPVPVSAEPQTSDFTTEDFFSADDDDDPGFGGRLRRRR